MNGRYSHIPTSALTSGLFEHISADQIDMAYSVLDLEFRARTFGYTFSRRYSYAVRVTRGYLHERLTSSLALSLSIKMPSYSSTTILGFGATCFITGGYTLLFPSAVSSALSLPPSALPAVRGNGLAAIAMGIYYTLASVQENRLFFAATVPMRLLTATVFWFQGGRWKTASLWEGIGAALTASTLLLEWNH